MTGFKTSGANRLKGLVGSIWGAGSPRSFKIAAWLVAGSIAAVWAYVDYQNQPPYMRSIEATQVKERK